MGQLPANVKVLKVHPSIGIARLSRIPEGSDYYYIFGSSPAAYKSGDLMKRQAVQFRLFAYGDNNVVLEELTPTRLGQLGIDAVWTALVGNQKIPNVLHGDPNEVLQAKASSDKNEGRLVATMPNFDEGHSIPLGQITPAGVFIPPQAAIFRRTAGQPISGHYPGSTDFCDNTCDGLVTVQLTDRSTGQPLTVNILGAWVVVVPQDFRPDTIDSDLNPRQPTLEEFLRDGLGLTFTPPAAPLNRTAWNLDHDSLRPCTAVFSPGIETNFDTFTNASGLSSAFFDSSATGDPQEVRVQPNLSGSAAGVTPGMLTANLCSPWQFDFMACSCGYWAAQRPDTLFKDASSSEMVRWLRKKVDDPSGAVGGLIVSSGDLAAHVDELGVGRKTGGRDVERERTKDIP